MEVFGSQLNQQQKRVIDSEDHRVENLSTEELTRLPKEERDRVITESAQAIISGLRTAGGVEYTNMADMYAVLGSMDILARRESPERVIDSLTTDTPID